MANMQFKCPQCGQIVEGDESFCGHVAECPYCGKGIVVPRNFTSISPATPSMSPPPKKKFGAPKPPRMEISHETALRQDRITPHPPSTINMAWEAYFVRAPWSVQFAAIFLIVFGCALGIGELLNCNFLSAIVSMVLLYVVGYYLPRFSFVRWLVVVVGLFSIIPLLFGTRHAYSICEIVLGFSLIAVAVLLLLKPSWEWYRGSQTEASPDVFSRLNIIGVIATIIAIVVAVFIEMNYSSIRGRHTEGYSMYSDDYSYASGSSNSGNSYTARRKSSDDTVTASEWLAAKKRWYLSQLDHYNLTEDHLEEGAENSYHLFLHQNDVPGALSLTISYMPSVGQISYPRIMAKSFAEKLVRTRIDLHKAGIKIPSIYDE